MSDLELTVVTGVVTVALSELRYWARPLMTRLMRLIGVVPAQSGPGSGDEGTGQTGE